MVLAMCGFLSIMIALVNPDWWFNRVKDAPLPRLLLPLLGRNGSRVLVGVAGLILVVLGVIRLAGAIDR